MNDVISLPGQKILKSTLTILLKVIYEYNKTQTSVDNTIRAETTPPKKYKYPLLPEWNCYCMGPRFVALESIDEIHFQNQNVQKQIHTTPTVV